MTHTFLGHIITTNVYFLVNICGIVASQLNNIYSHLLKLTWSRCQKKHTWLSNKAVKKNTSCQGLWRWLTFDDDWRCTQSRACIIPHFARVQTSVVHACLLDLQQKCVVLECDFTVRRWMDLYVIFVPSDRNRLGTSNTALEFERVPFCFFYCLREFFSEAWWN